MSDDFPKDGTTFVTEVVERATYRWARYKPDGARQMGKPGRFQKMVWQGDFFKWENAEPQGYLVQGDVGPLQARDAEILNLRAVLSDIANSDDFENALDPERNKRVARAALNGGSDAP